MYSLITYMAAAIALLAIPFFEFPPLVLLGPIAIFFAAAWLVSFREAAIGSTVAECRKTVLIYSTVTLTLFLVALYGAARLGIIEQPPGLTPSSPLLVLVLRFTFGAPFVWIISLIAILIVEHRRRPGFRA